MEFQDKVFGNVVRQLSQLPPFKELAQKAAAKTS
jgi:hypothetical protein